MWRLQIPLLLCLYLVALSAAFECPSLFQNVNGTCFRIIRNLDLMNYFEARTACRQLYPKTDLATIRCYAEDQYLFKELHTATPSTQQFAWIGLTGIMTTNHQFWYIEPRASEATYRNWKRYPPNPNNWDGEDHCGEIDSQYGRWNDRLCSRKNAYAICEYPSPDAGRGCRSGGNGESNPDSATCSIC